MGDPSTTGAVLYAPRGVDACIRSSATARIADLALVAELGACVQHCSGAHAESSDNQICVSCAPLLQNAAVVLLPRHTPEIPVASQGSFSLSGARFDAPTTRWSTSSRPSSASSHRHPQRRPPTGESLRQPSMQLPRHHLSRRSVVQQRRFPCPLRATACFPWRRQSWRAAPAPSAAAATAWCSPHGQSTSRVPRPRSGARPRSACTSSCLCPPARGLPARALSPARLRALLPVPRRAA